jgi:hypothetical protein
VQPLELLSHDGSHQIALALERAIGRLLRYRVEIDDLAFHDCLLSPYPHRRARRACNA